MKTLYQDINYWRNTVELYEHSQSDAELAYAVTSSPSIRTLHIGILDPSQARR